MPEPRELFPVTMTGSKTVVQSIGGTRNPDGTRAGSQPPSSLEEVPEPTEAELALIEAANAGRTADVDELAQIATVLDPPLDAEPDMAEAVGKGKGAPAKA